MAIDPSAEVHPTAVIEPGAEIGPGCRIGPYCVIGAEVALGPGVVLHSHVALAGRTRIGEATVIFPFASLGHIPQDLKFRGEDVALVIGARNTIREYITMNPGTEGGGGLTSVGDDNLFMMSTHVAHDCRIGNQVIMANNATLGGHCVVEDNVILGGLAARPPARPARPRRDDRRPRRRRRRRHPLRLGDRRAGAPRRPQPRRPEAPGRRARRHQRPARRLRRDVRGRGQPAGAGAPRAAERHPDNPLVAEIVDFVTTESARSFTVPAD